MNKAISKPREDNKANKPIVKKFDVSAAQRSRFIGVGGINLKRIYSKTGVTISPIDETYFSLFAPNKDALDEAEEMMKSLLEQPVIKTSFIFVFILNFFQVLLYSIERTRARIRRNLFGKDNRDIAWRLDGSAISKHEAHAFGQ
jgi:hypothetical protein